MRLLALVNAVSRALQRWKQGIPRGAATLYDCIASKVVEGSVHRMVVEKVACRAGGGGCYCRRWLRAGQATAGDTPSS